MVASVSLRMHLRSLETAGKKQKFYRSREMQSAECPQCGVEVSVGSQPKLGKLVKCKECGAELEVVWLDPLELDWPLDEDELDDDEEELEESEDEEY
jgi:alpha-aminoadipate carrier protein LysW